MIVLFVFVSACVSSAWTNRVVRWQVWNDEKEAAMEEATKQIKQMEIALHHAHADIVAYKMESYSLKLMKRQRPRANSISAATVNMEDFESHCASNPQELVTNVADVCIERIAARETQDSSTQTSTILEAAPSACLVCAQRAHEDRAGESQIWAGKELSRRVSTASKEPPADMMVCILLYEL